MEQHKRQALAAGGILLFGVLLGRACAPGRAEGPPDLSAGIRLVSLQLQGEKAITLPQGMEIGEVDGDWVRLSLSQDEDDPGRWIDFGQVASYALMDED